MVVEDDVDLSRVEEFALDAAGYRVLTARDGGAALEQLARERPAVILLDLRMPGINGREFISMFRTAYDHDIPIVVVTAAEDAQSSAAEIGAEDWLAKPFEVEELLHMVAKHVGRAPGTPP